MVSFHRQKLLLQALPFFALISLLITSGSSSKLSYSVLEHSHHHVRQAVSVAQNVTVPQNISIAQNFSTSALTQAQQIVAEAVRQQGE